MVELVDTQVLEACA